MELAKVAYSTKNCSKTKGHSDDATRHFGTARERPFQKSKRGKDGLKDLCHQARVRLGKQTLKEADRIRN